jgi:hypothetical protein
MSEFHCIKVKGMLEVVGLKKSHPVPPPQFLLPLYVVFLLVCVVSRNIYICCMFKLLYSKIEKCESILLLVHGNTNNDDNIHLQNSVIGSWWD